MKTKDREMDRLAVLVERITAGVATPYEYAEFTVLLHRRDGDAGDDRDTRATAHALLRTER